MTKNLYLGLAALGAVLPYVFFARFLASGDTTLGAFVSQLFATPAAAGFTTDLLITSLVFWVWSHGEAKRRGMRNWWAFVALNLVVGLSCALPAFLYVRAGSAGGAARHRS